MNVKAIFYVTKLDKFVWFLLKSTQKSARNQIKGCRFVYTISDIIVFKVVIQMLGCFLTHNQGITIINC